MSVVEPSGQVRSVGVGELFFSTTDRRGVVTGANALFVHYSGHPREALIGAPHNIVRHPDMPRAVFHDLWETVSSGEAFTGYVRNLARDGGAYDVLATVTPLGDGGYLSVRMGPACPDTRRLVMSLYGRVRDVEQARISDGASTRDAAREGAAHLDRLTRGEGLGSSAALQRAILPAEVARLEESGAAVPRRPGARGTAVGDALAAVEEIAHELGAWTREQNTLADLSTSLERAVALLREDVGRDAVATGGVPGDAGAAALEVWAQMQGIVAGHVAELVRVLAHLAENSARTRYRVALAVLHTRMMGEFAAEVIDGGGGCSASADAFVLLAGALREEVCEMDDRSAEHRRLTAAAAQSVTRVAALMEFPRAMLLEWQRTAGGTGGADTDGPGASGVAAVGAAVERASTVLAELAALADRCDALGARHDSTRLRALVDRVGGGSSVAAEELRHVARTTRPEVR